MKESTVYVANDGKQFDSADECAVHETIADYIVAMKEAGLQDKAQKSRAGAARHFVLWQNTGKIKEPRARNRK